jgi:hypothetical protein
MKGGLNWRVRFAVETLKGFYAPAEMRRLPEKDAANHDEIRRRANENVS